MQGDFKCRHSWPRADRAEVKHRLARQVAQPIGDDQGMRFVHFNIFIKQGSSGSTLSDEEVVTVKIAIGEENGRFVVLGEEGEEVGDFRGSKSALQSVRRPSRSLTIAPELQTIGASIPSCSAIGRARRKRRPVQRTGRIPRTAAQPPRRCFPSKRRVDQVFPVQRRMPRTVEIVYSSRPSTFLAAAVDLGFVLLLLLVFASFEDDDMLPRQKFK